MGLGWAEMDRTHLTETKDAQCPGCAGLDVRAVWWGIREILSLSAPFSPAR